MVSFYEPPRAHEYLDKAFKMKQETAIVSNDTQESGKDHAHTLRTTGYVADAFMNGGNSLKACSLPKEALQWCRDKPDIGMLHMESGLAALSTCALDASTT